MMKNKSFNARRAAPVLVFGSMAAGLLIGLGACGDVDQQAKIEKIYAGKKDTHAYDGEKFKGDKAKWEAVMAERSKTQNEYLRTDVK